MCDSDQRQLWSHLCGLYLYRCVRVKGLSGFCQDSHLLCRPVARSTHARRAAAEPFDARGDDAERLVDLVVGRLA